MEEGVVLPYLLVRMSLVYVKDVVEYVMVVGVEILLGELV
jgi:hypothetical protein